jgi:hypothetical protein
MNDALAEAVAAHREYREADDRLMAAIREAFPVGSEVYWDHGNHRVYGDVMWVSDWGSFSIASIGVRAHRSGKEYRVDAYRVLVAAAPEVSPLFNLD